MIGGKRREPLWLAAEPGGQGEMQLGMLVVLILLVTGLMALVVVCIVYGRRELAMTRGLIAGLTQFRTDTNVQAFARIPERRPLDAKAALEFYQRLHASPDWPVLAHKFQTDARAALLHCRTLADEGKGDAALFHAGAAHYAGQLAVLPEREMQQALGLLRIEAADKANQDKLAAGPPRPSRY